jgi:ABC-2 type transport system permease protein
VGLRWFAEGQPFTPMVEGVRGLLDGSPDGSTVATALVGSAVLSLVGYLWARHLYEREPAAVVG